MESILKNTEDSERLNTEAGALQNIVAWSMNRPMWQRDVLRRLCDKNSLDESDYEALMAIAKGKETTAKPLNTSHHQMQPIKLSISSQLGIPIMLML